MVAGIAPATTRLVNFASDGPTTATSEEHEHQQRAHGKAGASAHGAEARRVVRLVGAHRSAGPITTVLVAAGLAGVVFGVIVIVIVVVVIAAGFPIGTAVVVIIVVIVVVPHDGALRIPLEGLVGHQQHAPARRTTQRAVDHHVGIPVAVDIADLHSGGARELLPG